MCSSEEPEELHEDQELSWEDIEPCLIRECDEFPRYCRRWINFSPRKPFHVKTGYDRGFIQQKTKKGNPAALHGEWLTSCVERHLWNSYWGEQQIDEKRSAFADSLVANGLDDRMQGRSRGTLCR